MFDLKIFILIIYFLYFRWFHDGCCECVGATCINYGINDSRCLDCPLGGDMDDEDLDDLDYGDAFGDMDDNFM